MRSDSRLPDELDRIIEIAIQRTQPRFRRLGIYCQPSSLRCACAPVLSTPMPNHSLKQ